MIVQVHTDNHIGGSEKFTAFAESIVTSSLQLHADRLTRVDVHVSDESGSARDRGDDKRCTLEARPRGMQPVSVSHSAPSVEFAIEGAADKLEKLLTKTYERLGEHKGRTSYGGDQTI